MNTHANLHTQSKGTSSQADEHGLTVVEMSCLSKTEIPNHMTDRAIKLTSA